MSGRPFGQPALAVPAEPASGLSPSGFDQAHDVEAALENLLNAAERHIFGDECRAERMAARDALALSKRRRTAGADGLSQAKPDVQERYNELLYAVARRFEGETRHETALRYIRECELASARGAGASETAREAGR